MDFTNLTLVVPAKEKTDCLFHVLKELESFDIQKIVVIPNDRNFPENWKFKKIKVIKQKNSGYGNALLEGIEEVKTDFFCIFNADGSFNPNELEKMFILTNEYNFVFASRYLKDAKSDDDTLITSFGNYLFSLIGRIFFNIKLVDILYTFVIGNNKKFKELNVKSEDFCFCVELPIKMQRKKFSYIDVASHERNRISGKKNVNEFTDGLKILFKMIKLFFLSKNI